MISLKDARDKALEYRKLIANSIDPKKDKEEASRNGIYKTFRDVAEEAIAAKTETLRSTKHKQQWVNTIEIYALPVIGGLAPGEISRRDILDVLRPIWTKKPETADRVRQRLEGIFNYAISKEIIDGENPDEFPPEDAFGLLSNDLENPEPKLAYWALAQLGKKVVLIDLDLGLANADILLDVNPRYNLSNVISGRKTIEEVLVPAAGHIQVVPGASGLERLAPCGVYGAELLGALGSVRCVCP